EIEALISYVIHLSLRGQAEFEVTVGLLAPESEERVAVRDVRRKVLESLKAALGNWVESQKKPIQAGEYPYKEGNGTPIHAGDDLSPEDEAKLKKSVRQGHRNFYSRNPAAQASRNFGCASCHLDYGRRAQYFYDSWGTVTRPANLTLGVYRGGGRAPDPYYPLHRGINGPQQDGKEPRPPDPLGGGHLPPRAPPPAVAAEVKD